MKSADDPQIKLGRQVYAEECATCHSSKQPESPTGHPTRADVLWEQEFASWTVAQQKAWLKRPDRVAWFNASVHVAEAASITHGAARARHGVHRATCGQR